MGSRENVQKYSKNGVELHDRQLILEVARGELRNKSQKEIISSISIILSVSVISINQIQWDIVEKMN